MQWNSTHFDVAEELPELTDPHVSPFCIPSSLSEVAFPFLILESKSLQGDVMSCNFKMANSLIKALDVIASINLQHQLFVIGICQVGFAHEIWLSYSADDSTQADIPRKVSALQCLVLNLLTGIVFDSSPGNR